MGIAQAAKDPAIVMRRPAHPDGVQNALPAPAVSGGIGLQCRLLLGDKRRKPIALLPAPARFGHVVGTDHFRGNRPF